MYIQLICEVTMPSTVDKHTSYSAAIRLNPKSYHYMSTVKLQEFNWHFSRDDVNSWIERYHPGFADKITDGSDNRYWIMRNMGAECLKLMLAFQSFGLERKIPGDVMLILSEGRTQVANCGARLSSPTTAKR